jgi:glyoxylase-like metal-dependent hydrolase (beta-lactamase superfamily II)
MRRGPLEDMVDICPGLWLWRVRHPYWKPGDDWDPVVTTTVVESHGQVTVIDPVAPDDGAEAVWRRLDTAPPTQLVVLKPDHVRDVDWFADRYGAAAWGPSLLDPDDMPATRFSPLYPGIKIPGGIMAVNAGRWGVETPVWLSEYRALVFADALTEHDGVLRIWSTPWDEEGPRRVLRQLLNLPLERVIISHGRPVHDRAAYARALELDPWMSDELSEWAQQIQSYRQMIGLELRPPK